MTISALLAQLTNGLADAAALFLVAAGLSLIFGVTRVVNFAHGSLYMLGAYVACALLRAHEPSLAWYAVALGAAIVATALLGGLIEVIVLRRLYRAPELLQLVATFALVLLIRDAVLWGFGAEDLFAPRITTLSAAFTLFDRRFPVVDLLMIGVALFVLCALWLMLRATRFGRLVRAATQDRDMLSALGVNPRGLFTAVFALGAGLAGLGGALQTAHLPASLSLDLDAIGAAFVVVVVGGLGSIPGAFVAALLIGVTRALCIAAGDVEVAGEVFSLPRLTLVAEFLVMALVLAWRPYGLLGRALPPIQAVLAPRADARPAPVLLRHAPLVLLAILVALPLFASHAPYVIIVSTEILIAALYASSLQMLVGSGGIDSFGHAAYFGLGAYGAAWLLLDAHLPMELALIAAPLVAGIGAAVVGALVVRLSGIYLAMLTLACAQIAWSIAYEWDAATGGSTGLVGVWPAHWLSFPAAYFLMTLLFVAVLLAFLRRLPRTPFGLALRGARDHALRAEALGINTRRVRWAAFAMAGTVAGAAGALYVFSKGSVAPDVLGVDRSIDALVMVLLGGVSSSVGPWFGAALYTWLGDTLARHLEYWHAALGALMLLVVLSMPQGLLGFARAAVVRLAPRRRPGP